MIPYIDIANFGYVFEAAAGIFACWALWKTMRELFERGDISSSFGRYEDSTPEIDLAMLGGESDWQKVGAVWWSPSRRTFSTATDDDDDA